MHVYIAGTGKLANELLEKLVPQDQLTFSPWPAPSGVVDRCIVIHAGSGREIDAISAFCSNTSSVLIELSTGSALAGAKPTFPVVLCPNTNILMLKFMSMLERSGPLFKGCDIQIVESHQASKTSVPGTAVQIAHSLGIEPQHIVSVRQAEQQEHSLHIPPAHLARHAFHKISIENGPCSIAMETRIYGDSPYASGVQQIIAAVNDRTLDNRVYFINEFIENGWV